eukprot:12392706-Ditylum_brightwellii.AAC.1
MLVPLAEELKAKEEAVLPPFYADNLSLDGPAKANVRLMLHVMERGPNRGYFPEPTKSMNICDDESQVEVARAAFKELGLEVKFHDGFRYVENHISSDAWREEWVRPQVEALAEGVQ